MSKGQVNFLNFDLRQLKQYNIAYFTIYDILECRATLKYASFVLEFGQIYFLRYINITVHCAIQVR